MSQLGDRLKALRGATSQSEMARTLGLTRPQYINYENGKNAPGAEILARICITHAVSADWLLGIDPNNRGTATAIGDGATAIVGSNNVVGKPPADCRKCPYKKKLAALEKLLAK